MEDTKQIKSFIDNVNNKNYKQANLSLQKMIENKLKLRVKEALTPEK